MVNAALNEVFEEKKFVVSRLSRKAYPASKRQKGTQSCLVHVERKTKKILLAKGRNRRKKTVGSSSDHFPSARKQWLCKGECCSSEGKKVRFSFQGDKRKCAIKNS